MSGPGKFVQKTVMPGQKRGSAGIRACSRKVSSMADDLERLRSTLRELKDELHSVAELDSQTRQSLEEVVRDIHASLHDSETPHDIEHQRLTDKLRQAAHGFEESHPTLAGIVSRMIDGLSQIGI
jgi:chromosome segregation ATPase